MLERHDCLNWAQWVDENNPDNLPVYLVGFSMGAATVLMALCAGHHDLRKL